MGLGGDLGTIWASMKFDVSGVSAGVDRVKRDLATSGGYLKKHSAEVEKFGKSWSLGITAPIVAGLGLMLNAAKEEAGALHALQVSLDHTGDATAANMKRLTDYANAMMAQTVYSHEAIQEQMAYMHNLGVQTPMLDKAATAAMGLAAKYKIDLSTAAMLVGRASQGATAMLGRYGIVLDENMTKEQKFNALLKIGGDNFDLARKQTETFSGSLQQMRNYVDEIAESFGAVLLPSLKDVVVGVKDFAKGFSEIDPAQARLIVGIAGVVAAIGPLTILLAKLPGLIAGVQAGWLALAGVGGPTVVAIAAVVAAGYGLYKLIQYLNRDTVAEARATADVAKKQADQAASTKQLVGEYEQLAQKTNRTAGESERMHGVLQQIWALNPSLISAFDAQRGALGLVSGAYQRASAEAQRYGNIARSAQIVAVGADIREHQKTIADLTKRADEASRRAMLGNTAVAARTTTRNGWLIEGNVGARGSKPLTADQMAFGKMSDKEIVAAAAEASKLASDVTRKQQELKALQEQARILAGGKPTAAIPAIAPVSTGGGTHEASAGVAGATKAAKAGPSAEDAQAKVRAEGQTRVEVELAVQAAIADSDQALKDYEETARAGRASEAQARTEVELAVQAAMTESDQALKDYEEKRQQVHDKALSDDLERWQWDYEHNRMSRDSYVSALQEKLAAEQEFSDNWKTIHGQIETAVADEAELIVGQARHIAETSKATAIAMLQDWSITFTSMGTQGVDAAAKINAALDEMQSKTKETAGFWDSIWGYTLDSFKDVMGNIRTSFADALANMIQGLSTFGDFMKQVWHQILVFVINVIIQMVAEWIAGQRKMAASQFTPSGGGSGNSWLGTLVGLIPFFDNPINDTRAVRSGSDFGRLFRQGIESDLGLAFPGSSQRQTQPVAAASGSMTNNNVQVTTHIDKVTGIDDIERMSETQAWLIGQHLNTVPSRA